MPRKSQVLAFLTQSYTTSKQQSQDLSQDLSKLQCSSIPFQTQNRQSCCFVRIPECSLSNSIYPTDRHKVYRMSPRRCTRCTKYDIVFHKPITMQMQWHPRPRMQNLGVKCINLSIGTKIYMHVRMHYVCIHR